MNGDLPCHSSVIEEKLERQHKSSWIKPIFLAIPGVPNRRLRILVPNVGPFNRQHMARIKRKRGPLLVVVACLAVFLTVVIVTKGIGHSDWNNQWQGAPTSESSTLVFKREDLQIIWKWEIASGHYPSSQSSPSLSFSLFNQRRLITFSS
jgi:WD repeat and SOF domain-containing protein 1